MKVVFVAVLSFLACFNATTGHADAERQRAVANAHLDAGDEKKAFKIYHDLARRGDHDAQFELSRLYAEGSGVRQNHITAFSWAALAAESGNPEYKQHSVELFAQSKDPIKTYKEADKLKKKYGRRALGEDLNTDNCLESDLQCTQSAALVTEGSP